MKNMSRLVLVLLAVFAVGSAEAAGRSTRVRSYTTKKGTYVQSHRRASADGTKSNNWSTKGNVNPYTGKRGTK